MKQRKSQQGGVELIIIIVLVIALLGALGYILWNNMQGGRADDAELDETVLIDEAKSQSGDEKKTIASADVDKYYDFRTNKKDITGTKVSSANDVSQLTGVGSKLKSYFETNVGGTVQVMGGQINRVFVVDRLQGNYGAGTESGKAGYVIWGPASGTGDIEVVASTQNAGMNCEELKAAKVPAELVDGKCLVVGQGLTSYIN